MRSPIIAFSIVAAAAVSPALVAAAPTSPNLPGVSQSVPNAKSLQHMTRQLDARDSYHTHQARVDDSGTAGGNAYTGTSSNVNGGDIYNEADSNDAL
ncbi:hypothetical protein K474DRAFT_842513 [Panus rudis PR-1116 ss-1]|nr:hypothetical protein K474DRAFT_842513 [Panus rudis PR-1116 ss-1]